MLTSYIAQQFAKSPVISLAPEFVGGDNAPATLKLSDLEFKGERVLVKGKIYWQASTTDGEIQPYVKKRPVDPSWAWGKIHFAEWKNLDRFSPEVIEYFHRLRGLWDLHIKGGGKITPNIQPWWIPKKGVAFKLSKEGEIWRASQINFGAGTWNGRGNQMAATEETEVLEINPPAFSFSASAPVTPTVTDPVPDLVGDIGNF